MGALIFTEYMSLEEAMKALGIENRNEFWRLLYGHAEYGYGRTSICYRHPRRRHPYVYKSPSIYYGDAVRSLAHCEKCMGEKVLKEEATSGRRNLRRLPQ